MSHRARMSTIVLSLLVMAVLVSVVPSTALAATETWRVSVSEGVSVRSSASTSATRIGALANGSTIVITSTKSAGGYSWGYISSSSPASGSWGTFNGGWVALNYCSKAAPAATPAPAKPFPASCSIVKAGTSPMRFSCTVNTSVPVDSVMLKIVMAGQVYNGYTGTPLTKSSNGKSWSLTNRNLVGNTSYKFYFIIKNGSKT